MKIKNIVLLLVLMLVGVSAYGAASYEFRNRNRDNDYLGSSTWKTNGNVSVSSPPIAGSIVYVTSGTGYNTLITVANDVSVDYRTLIFKAQPSSSFKFYTTGNAHTFEMPSSSGGLYAKPALIFQDGDAAQYAVIESVNAGPVCSWTDPEFTLASDGSSVSTLVFSSGTFDFLTPGGIDVSANNTYIQNNRPGTVLFGTNVVVKLPKVTVNHISTHLLFRGSQATWKGLVNLMAGRVEVTDGATVSASGDNIQITGLSVPSLTISNATFTTAKNIFVGMGNDGKLIIEDGANVKIDGGDAIQVGHSAGNGGVEVRGGTLNTSRIRVSRSTAGAEKTAYFLQTGGTTKLSGTGIQFQQGCTDNNVGTHYVRLDGGVLETKSIFRDATVTAGTAYLSGNGGRYKATASGSIAYNLSYAEFGEKGLTVDTAGYNNTFDVEGRNKSGANGLFVKDGAGTLTLSSSSWNVSRTSVTGGTLLISSSKTLSTTLTVEPGATLSTVGAASDVTVDSLAMTNATLALDPGDVITVTGPLSVRKLSLNWSSVPSAEEAFLVVSGEMDEGTKAAIRSAVFANALSDGTHASFSFSYDAGTGKTTVSASVAADVPLTDSVTWTGSGAWATGGNWSGSAAPTASQIASFTSSTAGKTVTVASGDKAGALAFGADGYTLTGTGPLAIAGEAGSTAISATAGANTIDVPILLSAMTPISVEAGASLAIAKPISYGGIAKTGTGKLTLDADNSPESGVFSSDGILEVTAAGALGPTAADNVTLRSGTVQFAGANGAAMHIPANFSVAATSSTDLVVFKTDTDTTIDALDVVQGAICKRGVGKLTINVPADTTYKLAWANSGTVGTALMQNWFPNGATGIEFPADGTAPDSSGGLYPGFSVAEGELAFVGTGANAKVNMNYARVLVGLYAKTCAAQPMLTVDNVYCDCLYNAGIFLGHNVGANNIGVTNPVLRIVNGGTLRIGYAQMGYGSTTARSFVTVAATNGTFIVADSGHYLTRLWGGNGAKAYYRFKDSRHYFDGANKYIGGGIDLDFDNSVFSSSSGDIVTLTGEDNRPWGVLAFRNGSTFAYGGFTENSIAKDLTFAFDDAELLLHKNRASATLAASGSGHVRYEMRGAGAVLKPASGATYTINAKLEGAGGLVVDGAGTVAFGANSAQFTGTLDVRQGVADFSANGGEASFTAVKGPGTVSGATMGAVSLPLTLLADGTPSNVVTFSDCTFNGVARVDLGRTEADPMVEPYPENLLVARYSGTSPVGKMRLVGTGCKNLRGEFTAANGEVRMTVKPIGFRFIVR